MAYKPIKPNKSGLVQLYDISLRETVPFIHWKFFFHAWRLSGKYDGIDALCDCNSCKTQWLQKFAQEEREKAEEALKLFRDAQEELLNALNKNSLKINATFAIFPAFSENDDIHIEAENQRLIIPTLRQQQPSSDGFCYALSDFLANEKDYVGLFATSVLGAQNLADAYEKKGDLYRAILIKTLADRLAEASAEYLHYQIRKNYWGYSPDEVLNIEEMLKTHYQGIRPAIGYPSLPDQSIIFELDKILHLEKIGIKLTENGAMFPNASVCGLYFAHPKAKYFMVGKIDDEQLKNYAQRRKKTVEEMRKWLVSTMKI